jgi:cell division protein FtsL
VKKNDKMMIMMMVVMMMMIAVQWVYHLILCLLFNTNLEMMQQRV